MRPREYAAQIIAGQRTLGEVPDHFQNMVSSLLEEHAAVVWSRAHDIAQLPTLAQRREALYQLDPALQPAVQEKLKKLWRERTSP